MSLAATPDIGESYTRSALTGRNGRSVDQGLGPVEITLHEIDDRGAFLN